MRLAGRSRRELVFRLRQSLGNLSIWALPPKASVPLKSWPLLLPEPHVSAARLQDSAFKVEIFRLAEEIVAHRFCLFGSIVQTGPQINWRRDYPNEKESGLAFFKFVPYLNFEESGDHKNVWELNRHQHLVVLAQAFLFDGDPRWVDEIRAQLHSWRIQNPFLQGINWASALEVAFRALSWLWATHLTGLELGTEHGLFEHGTYLEHNLSTYFSPNTHLLGEAVALHAIGINLGVEKWRALGSRIVTEELSRQVQADGSHFEQSTYYHVYALDFFLVHYIFAGRPEAHRETLVKMGRFLGSIMGSAGVLTFLGDDDGGRLFHPYGDPREFGRATLATCAQLFPEENFPWNTADFATQAAWWVGDPGKTPVSAAEPHPCHFANSGLTVMAEGGTQILIDAGPFGAGGAAHSHADTLSITARKGDRDILIDPGTYTYVADRRLRDAFRGTGFHNTIRIDDLDQAEAVDTFRWEHKPDVRVHARHRSFLDAECRYHGFTHRRRVLMVNQVLLVLDEVTGLEGLHRVDQLWHLGDEPAQILYSDPTAVTREGGLLSRTFGRKESGTVMRASWQTQLPHLCAAALCFEPFAGELRLHGLELTLTDWLSISFAAPGMPVVTVL